MRRTDASQHHNVTALRATHPLVQMTWLTSRVRNWCHCRWSNSSWSMSTTMSVSHYTPMIRCASHALLTTLSPCVGHLMTSPWWPPAPSPWSPTHWLACSPCTTSTLLVAARTVPTYPMAIPQHEYSSVVFGWCRNFLWINQEKKKKKKLKHRFSRCYFATLPSEKNMYTV